MTYPGQIVPATPEHGRAIAARLLPHDLLHLRELPGWDAERAVLTLLETADAWAWEVAGEAICIAGVTPQHGCILDASGHPWLIATQAMRERRLAMLRHWRLVLDRMLAIYPRLEGWCDLRNETSLRWIRWMGFGTGEAFDFRLGVNPIPALPFWMDRPCR